MGWGSRGNQEADQGIAHLGRPPHTGIVAPDSGEPPEAEWVRTFATRLITLLIGAFGR